MAGVSNHRKAEEFVFSVLPFTKTFQLKQKAFSTTLGVLIEILVALSPFNSEHQLLKFSDAKALFWHGTQRRSRREIFISGGTRMETQAGDRHIYYKRTGTVLVGNVG